MKIIIQLVLILFFNTNLGGQIGRLHLSPRQSIEQNIGLTNIEINYSRPSTRGRKIFGGLIAFDKYWRTGANQNTTISFDQTIFIDGKMVEKGKYSLITKPGVSEWDVLLYADVNNWDVPDEIDTSKIIAEISVPSRKLAETKKVLSIEIGDFTNYEFDLHISWEDTRITIPIILNTRQLMKDKIDDELNGPQYDDFYLAAVYEMESGMNYEKGLEWINKAIELNEERGWWDLRVKSILLIELNRMNEAKVLAKEGSALAKKDNRESMVKEFNRILNTIK